MDKASLFALIKELLVTAIFPAISLYAATIIRTYIKNAQVAKAMTLMGEMTKSVVLELASTVREMKDPNYRDSAWNSVTRDEIRHTALAKIKTRLGAQLQILKDSYGKQGLSLDAVLDGMIAAEVESHKAVSMELIAGKPYEVKVDDLEKLNKMIDEAEAEKKAGN